MELYVYQVDSFTSEVFKGNPAGVCITDTALDESTMFAIAAEMAVSETAFLVTDTMQLRWFTPEVEVKLCGHGTLAVAHVLQEQGLYQVGDRIEFNTLSGVLTAELGTEDIHLTFPAPELSMDVEIDEQLIERLGIPRPQVVDYGCFDSKQLIVINDEAHLHQLNPDFSGLLKLKGRGLVVTAKSKDDVDFVSRYFAPWVGVNEDPVTGSAHCALSVYWSTVLNKTKLKGYQASRRGGFVDVEQLDVNTVKLSGKAVTVLKGQMRIA
ncbi:PhzF family phenazine biosynthesis protein [Vibrio sp. Y2-5]|uniref:PhzF family phenazine biosynthesis protein n=1 Tax=Vibrio sp. Y2-5 TaxID=2743977 RepID=UPI001660C795|nr:PhzF family phenazine biosynthesis protein [Vibrio sp. Y2-5]